MAEIFNAPQILLNVPRRPKTNNAPSLSDRFVLFVGWLNVRSCGRLPRCTSVSLPPPQQKEAIPPDERTTDAADAKSKSRAAAEPLPEIHKP